MGTLLIGVCGGKDKGREGLPAGTGWRTKNRAAGSSVPAALCVVSVVSPFQVWGTKKKWFISPFRLNW